MYSSFYCLNSWFEKMHYCRWSSNRKFILLQLHEWQWSESNVSKTPLVPKWNHIRWSWSSHNPLTRFQLCITLFSSYRILVPYTTETCLCFLQIVCVVFASCFGIFVLTRHFELEMFHCSLVIYVEYKNHRASSLEGIEQVMWRSLLCTTCATMVLSWLNERYELNHFFS